MKILFDSYVENAFGKFEQAEFKIEQFKFNYKKFFPTNKEAFVLDIGVGRGEMLTIFKELGYKNYLGIDISSSCVNFCKSLNLKVELVNDVITFLEDKPNLYELITLLDVLEHINKEDVIKTLIAIRSSLKENGILIIQVPNLNSPEGFLHMFNDFSHINGFNEHSLAQVLIAAGFKNFSFYPFETIIGNSIKKKIKKFLRNILYFKYNIERRITENLCYQIMTPIFYAVVKKEK